MNYRDVYHQNEVEQSAYNFEHADVAELFHRFDACEAEALKLVELGLPLPAYDQVCKASHSFNLLDARRAISVTERQRYILRVRKLAQARRRGVLRAAREARLPGPEEDQLPEAATHWTGMRMEPLLIELGTEELPVKALPGLAQAFCDGVHRRPGEARHRVRARRRQAAVHAAPPRGAAAGRRRRQPEQRSEVLGPYLNIALDADGQPTRALQGFAQKAGVDWTRSRRTSDAKGERFVHRAVKPGAKTADLLPEIVREAIAAMPIPKPMRWGDHDYAFVRPVHWLVLLFGDDVVAGEVLGVPADRISRGHRFHHDKPVWIGAPGDYVEALRGANVLVDPDERRARIVREVETAAARAAGGSARIDAGILEEVNCLTEWPSAVPCSFEREFLRVPQEALIATMEDEPEVLPGARRRRQAHASTSSASPTSNRRTRPRSARATSA